MTTTVAAPDSKVLICLNHGAEEPENVLIAYLVGVESLRAGKEAVMFLTKDAIHLATPGSPRPSTCRAHHRSPTCTRSTSPRAAG